MFDPAKHSDGAAGQGRSGSEGGLRKPSDEERAGREDRE